MTDTGAIIAIGVPNRRRLARGVLLKENSNRGRN